MAALPLILYGCAQQTVSVDPVVRGGQMVATPGKPGYVVGAPYGSSDAQTAAIATEIARRTGFGLVVASGAGIDAGGALTYERRVREIAQGRLAFFVEILGNARRESAHRIEIATVGVDREYAARLRTLLELTRDAHLRGRPGTPRLAVLVEPADTLSSAGGASRREGLLPAPARALHVELPQVARTDARELYVTILAEFLTQAATLPPGR